MYSRKTAQSFFKKEERPFKKESSLELVTRLVEKSLKDPRFTSLQHRQTLKNAKIVCEK
jgi:hypothetical protein